MIYMGRCDYQMLQTTKKQWYNHYTSKYWFKL